MTLVKICGVRDPETAIFAAEKGATFIGIIFEPSSPRYVGLERAKEIALAAKQSGCTPVGVFTTHDEKEIQEICNAVGLECVQLHGEEARRAHRDLPSTMSRLFVIHVEESGAIREENLEGLDPKRDFLLYDGVVPGSGNPFNWGQFEPNQAFRFFLAGGLNPDNVSQAIKMKHPTGVDVSSGVENPATKKKDWELIRLFIQSVQEEI